MSNQLEKLKNSIKQEYVNNFELNLMQSSGFIPVDKRQTNLYVIINKNNAQNKSAISAAVKEKYPDLTPQFIHVENSDFVELLKTVQPIEKKTDDKSDISKQSDSQPQSQELSAEDMLVGIGWITEEQLTECKRLALEKKLPLDAIFYDKQYLSTDKIASYLQKKYGNKVVSLSDINPDKSILKMLPDDFIEKKKTIIL